MAETLALRQAAPVRWAKVVDHTRCIGCHACSTACKSENQVPVGVHRTYVKYVDATGKARKAHEEWMSRTRPAILHSPDGTRRPYWLLRPLKPGREAYALPGPRFGL